MTCFAHIPGLIRDLHVNASNRSRITPGTAEV